ncbi:HypC/HybG/HupF family hydrogenase formation chaperone [Actinomadura sp. NEAU-AAG7]|uniref:HypC/HybG/HupF family hydrogenase formation chaperone n=1 Tax=Actinomadura sp. NEAU-AAG7 TaxID=2839640 RepID=UPI001BE40B10|nr:HypC/HybG/HupF family hydrogenase formation chaperone [Actinomadura sp. NEAU-AAG7]MBT2212681.1 HypC/HybG/HupF family hydrogenase formation chaperone [Actinomadura sp. NEAU-AAG7]
MCLGIPGRVIEVHGEDPRMGVVDFDGVRREVCLAFTPDADVGQYVIVHVGFAISTVDEEEAARTLAVIRAIPDALAAELGADEEPPVPAGRRPAAGMEGTP